MSSILSSSPLFNVLPQISTYPNIACLIAAQTPIAQTLNGQAMLKQYIDQCQKENAARTNKVIQLGQIAKYYQFNLFKTFQPKLIFSRFISRNFPGTNNSQTLITNADYASEVQFKIDFDSSVISDLVALITMNISIDQSILSDNTPIQIQGYSSKGSKSGVNIKYSDVLSLQYAYCEDFLYHYISSVDIGFCNTGGSNPIYHQKVPIEIAWIYHRLILPQEMGDAIKRLCREDIFTIGHDPFHMYGNYMYQMKASNDLNNNYSYYKNQEMANNFNGKVGFNRNAASDAAQGMNEIAMYYVQNTIKGLDMGTVSKSDYANDVNWTIGKSNPTLTEVTVYDKDLQTTHKIKKFDVISSIDNIMFGNWNDYNVKFEQYTTHTETDTDKNGQTVTKTVGGFTDPISQVSPVSPIMYNCSTNRMISLDPIVKFVKKASAGLPQAQFDKYNIYVVPFIYSAISNGVTLSTGFAVVSKQTAKYSTEAVRVKVTVNCNTQSEEGLLNTDQEIKMYINCNTDGVTQIRRVNNIILNEENSDLEEPLELLKAGETDDKTPDTNLWYIKQYSIDEFYGCALFVGTTNITNLDKETIFTSNIKSENKCYTLTNKDSNQFKEVEFSTTYNDTKNEAFVIECKSGSDADATIFDILNACLHIKNTTLKDLLTQTQMSLFKKSGYISPYINIGSLNYLLVESNDFDLNDFGWDAMYQTYYKNTDQSVYPQNSPDLINDIFKYNMAMLNNKDNEEFNPTLRNPDYISIHTFRKEHGIVDFYFPLNFLFICQGISSGFPHYACASQSLVIKFSFLNPKAFINTCLVVRPDAVDKLDCTQGARVYINRINTHQFFTTNCTDMRMVLFYNRYVWVPDLTDIITNYNHYAWVIRNYERIYRDIGGQVSGQSILYEFSRSVFYTKIWLFIINTDTYNVLQAQGGASQIQPLYVNKYHLPIFDVVQFQESAGYNNANSITGSTAESWNKQYNSPYGLVPVDSFQMATASTIGMQDTLPYRLQQFADYVMLNHTQAHQTITNNNLIQFNIDPIFYQEGTPNATYAPAYAPNFYIKYNPKLQSGYNRKYGCIIISECMNISYISNHVVLSKYQTDN